MSASSPPPRFISDELWALAEPLIPPRKPAVHGRTGRPRTSDRDVLEGIAIVLSTGIGWTKLVPRQATFARKAAPGTAVIGCRRLVHDLG